jgi:hypothetical protein
MFQVTCCVTEACEYVTSLQRRVHDASEDAETQFSQIFNKCIYYSLAADESADITLTT